MKNTVLYWFSHDLRISDNLAFTNAVKQADELVCLVCVPPQWFKGNRYCDNGISDNRWRFIKESIADLNAQLDQKQHKLLVKYQHPYSAISSLCNQLPITQVVCSEQVAFDERSVLQKLTQQLPDVTFFQYPTHTLYQLSQLPFAIAELPTTFSQFRKQVETELVIEKPLTAPVVLPKPVTGLSYQPDNVPILPTVVDTPFVGGSHYGVHHLDHYCEQRLPDTYKQTRNELDGWENSSKLSAWLALGCISPKQAFNRIKAFEGRNGANESTYWLIFELLWREYFQWYALQHGSKLFRFQGIKSSGPNTSYYPERFKKWCAGQTPYPIVNACMKQLKQTGYMSNRGRQLVASCLVHELSLDWRFGAAYFEQQLIDYDVCANWGNWQYLAGVGADPRGHRQFDLAKQTQQYDPEGSFIKRWQGDTDTGQLDSVDAADWPS